METKIKRKRFWEKDKKAGKEEKSKKLLISINVFGSAGAMRLMVKGDDDATAVIDTALKMYSRQGRLPILGSDAHSFFLYPANVDFQEEAALSPRDKIGWGGARNFVLSKRLDKPEAVDTKGSGNRACLHKIISSCLGI